MNELEMNSCACNPVHTGSNANTASRPIRARTGKDILTVGSFGAR